MASSKDTRLASMLGLMLALSQPGAGCRPRATSELDVANPTSSRLPEDCGAKNTQPLYRIMKNEERQHLCSGIFIAPNLLATAAHCLLDLERLEIRRSFHWTRRSETWHAHPGFDAEKIRNNTGSRFDVGVVDFSDASGDVHYSSWIVPAHFDGVKVGQQVAFAGYGPNTLAELQAAEEGRYDISRADLSWGANTVTKVGLGPEDPTLVSTGGAEEGAFTYKGDSGGPMFAHDSRGKCGVAGVVSRGNFEISLFTNFADPEIAGWLKGFIEAAHQKYPRS